MWVISASSLFLVVLITFAAPTASAAQQGTTIRNVTHEDIRDAILSLVHMFRDNTDKLERHEYRERQLGEQLKKSFSAVEKKQKTEETNLNSILESLTNIDKRLQAIEATTATTQQSEMRAEHEGGGRGNTEAILNKLNSIDEALRQNAAMEDLKSATLEKIDGIAFNMDNIRNILKQLSDKTAGSQNQDVIGANITSTLEMKLSEIQPLIKEWQSSLAAILAGQQTSIELIKTTEQRIVQYAQLHPNTDFLLMLNNNTAEIIQQVKYDLLLNEEKSVSRLHDRISKAQDILSEQQSNILKAVSDGIVTAEGLYQDVKDSYEQLVKEISGLLKVEQVLIQTADNVLDTKRRIEYGTHQILLEVGDLIKQQAKDMNATINGRFDEISATILDNQNGGLTNLSSKIETEISQVWRQIGIMYQTLTASAVALDRLQQQTEIYVNGSLNTMDNMEGKVGQITGRMSEVDENLNYLLGRLSLVTQEFNQIKTGLGEALDNIRSSFHTVQQKVKDVGPGPNPIEESHEVAPELTKSQYVTS